MDTNINPLKQQEEDNIDVSKLNCKDYKDMFYDSSNWRPFVTDFFPEEEIVDISSYIDDEDYLTPDEYTAMMLMKGTLDRLEYIQKLKLLREEEKSTTKEEKTI